MDRKSTVGKILFRTYLKLLLVSPGKSRVVLKSAGIAGVCDRDAAANQRAGIKQPFGADIISYGVPRRGFKQMHEMIAADKETGSKVING